MLLYWLIKVTEKLLSNWGILLDSQANDHQTIYFFKINHMQTLFQIQPIIDMIFIHEQH